MRKLAALLTLFVLAVSFTPAHAKWITDEIQWRRSSVGTPFSGTQLYVRDTAFTVLGGTVTLGGVLDTTAHFSLTDAMPFLYEAGADHGAAATPNRSDSLIAGWLIVQSDSSTVPTGAMSSISFILEGRPASLSWPGTSLANWTPIDSLTALCVDGDTNVPIVIPVRGGRKITTRPGTSPFAYDQLRARCVASVGALPSARVFIRYWVPTVTPNTRGQ